MSEGGGVACGLRRLLHSLGKSVRSARVWAGDNHPAGCQRTHIGTARAWAGDRRLVDYGERKNSANRTQIFRRKSGNVILDETNFLNSRP